jgi:hypothetical protein
MLTILLLRKNVNFKEIQVFLMLNNEQYKVGKSTITDILKEKERWPALCATNATATGKMTLTFHLYINTKHFVLRKILSFLLLFLEQKTFGCKLVFLMEFFLNLMK